MEFEITNAGNIRRKAKKWRGDSLWAEDHGQLREIIAKQDALLIRAADRIEELESGIRAILSTMRNEP